ncbi:MAG: hypothetical protein GQE15_10360 [Archangiaceae bacterium]|nr:hypothetical protein [Archangiaceae bacterium]
MRLLIAAFLVMLPACQCGERVMGSGSRFVVEPASVEFGDVGVGKVELKELVGRVVGRAGVRLSSVSIEQSASKPFSTTLAPRVANAGDEVRFVVQYTAPSSSSADVGVLVIDLDGDQVRVPLSARVPASCSPRTSCLVLESATAMCGQQPDGCGGFVSCVCAKGQQCVAQRCVDLPRDAGLTVDAGLRLDAGVTVDAGSCLPTSCTARGAVCGSLADGCGGTLDCGTCGNGASCQQNACVCAGGAEQCGDGVDNDCDGNVDCADPDCASVMACAQPACTITAPEVQVTFAPGNAFTAFIGSVGNGQWGVIAHESFGNSNLRYSYQRLDAQLQPVGAAAPMVGMLAAHKPFAAWTGSEFGLAWSDTRNQSNDVYFTRLSVAGQRMLAADVPISTLPGLEFPASIGWNAGAQEFGVVWGDSRPPAQGNDRSLYFRRVNAQGLTIGAEVSLTSNPTGVATDYSDLVWGGSNWGLVVTQLRNDTPYMLFHRLSSTGVPELNETQLNAVGQGAFQPRIATSPNHYGVVFQEYRGTAFAQSDIIFTRLSKSGPANAVRVPLTTSGGATLPTVVWTGAGWLVFFADQRTGVSRIWATRLDANGVRVGSDELISCMPGAASFPHASFDGTRVAVVWESNVGGLSQAFVKSFVP